MNTNVAIRSRAPRRGVVAMKSALLRLWHSPTFTTWGSLVVRAGGVLLVLPLVLVRFAPAEVALWQLFITLYMFAMMLDFGLAPTFARMLAFARGGAGLGEMSQMQGLQGGPRREADSGAASEVMATMRWLYPRVALALTLMLACVGTWSLMKPVSQTSDVQAAWIAWALVLVTTGISIWGGAFAAGLQGMNRIAQTRRWEIATGLGQIATALVVLLLGGQLLALVAAYQGWLIVAALRNRWLLRQFHPELFKQAPGRHREALAVMWPAAWRSGVGVVMSHGLVHASSVIYSQLAPAAETAAYLIALRIVMVISQFAQAPFYSKLPRLAELQAGGRQAEQLVLAQRGMRLGYWVYVAGAVLVALAAAPLMQLIGSRTAFVSGGVWALLALAFFAERFGAMHLQLYSLTNHILWHIANGISGLLMIVLALCVYPLLGAHALPASMLLAYLGFYCVYSSRQTRRAFRLRLLRFEASTSAPAAAALCAGLALSLLWTPQL